MSDWRNLNDVMQDLSMAQGNDVPAALEVIGNTPPTLNTEEDTQSYYSSCGDVNFNIKPPDVNLIQEMLNIVSSKNDLNQNTKLSNGLNISQEHVPQVKGENGITRRNKIEKNVAIKSILEAQERNIRDKKPDILNSPNSMFRRKETYNVTNIPLTSVKSDNISLQCQYTPSDKANEYYNKYLANSKLKEQIEERVSPITERFIAEVPIRKKRRSEVKSNSENGSLSSDTGYRLLHHRHLYLENVEECVVCHVTAKHGYSFKVDDKNCDNLLPIFTNNS